MALKRRADGYRLSQFLRATHCDKLSDPLHRLTYSKQAENLSVGKTKSYWTINKEGQHFGYIFDLGDYWPHELEVSAIAQGPLQGGYPIMLEKVGPSPPQSAEDERDEEDWEDE